MTTSDGGIGIAATGVALNGCCAGKVDIVDFEGSPATSIINNSTETILSHTGPDLKTVLLGPSTPMLPKAFAGLPINMPAGAAIIEPRQTLKLVRRGGSARALKPFTRRVYWLAA